MEQPLDAEMMMAIIERHLAAEAAGDVALTMESVAPEPLYEFHPMGYRIASRDSVAELYRRVLPSQKQRTGVSIRRNLWFSAEGCAIETESRFNDETGREHVAANIVAFTFEAGLIKSERVFLDPKAPAAFDAALGVDFLSLPGVSVRR